MSRKKITRIALVIFARGSGAAVTVGLTVYLARAYGAEFSGYFYYFVSVLSVAGLATRLGAEQYLTATVPENLRRPGGLPAVQAAFLSVLIAAALVAVALLAIGLILAQIDSATYMRVVGKLPSVVPLFLALLGFNAAWIAGGFSRSCGHANVSILLETGLFPVWIAITLMILHHLVGGVPSISDVAYATAILFPAFIIFVAVKNWRVLPEICGRLHLLRALRGLFEYCSVTVANSFIVWMPILVFGYFDQSKDLAIYNATFRVTMLIGAFAIVIKSMVISDWLEKGNKGADRLDDLKRSLVLAAPFLLITGATLLGGDWIWRLFGPEFKALKSILPLMMLAQTVNVAGYLMETKLVLEQRTQILAVVAVLTAAAALIGAPLLIRSCGLWGGAMSFLITATISRVVLAVGYWSCEA